MTPAEGIPEAFWIDGYDALDEIPEFEEGILYVQDISSMMVAKTALENCSGDGLFALDVCAAPGGKSIHMAQLFGERGRVEARDLTEYKAELIEENRERCGVENLCVRVWDATVFDPSMEGAADLVIADLPCSGLGVIGSKTDIKYRVTPEKIGELAALQRQILSVVRRYVKDGGILMYSTCTVTEEENQENVAWFFTVLPGIFAGNRASVPAGRGLRRLLYRKVSEKSGAVNRNAARRIRKDAVKDRPQGRRDTESRENEREQNRKSGKWQATDRRRTEDRYQIASLSAVRAVDLGAGGKEIPCQAAVSVDA